MIPGRAAQLLGHLTARRGSLRHGQVREGLVILTGQVLAVVGSVITVKLITRWLSPELYGDVGLVLSVCTLVQLVVTGPTVQGATRYYQRYQAEGRLGHLAKGTALLLAPGYALSLLLWAGWVAFEVRHEGRDVAAAARLAAAGFGFGVAQDVTALALAVLSLLRRRVAVAVLQSAVVWVRTGAVGVLLWAFGGGALGCVLGYLVAQAVCAALAVRVTTAAGLGLHEGWLSRSAGATRAELLRFAWPFSIWGAFAWMQSAADRWVVAASLSREDLGVYTLAVQLGAIAPLILSQGLNTLLQPGVFRPFRTRAERRDYVRKALRIAVAVYAAATLAGFALVFLLGPWLVTAVARPAYAESAILWRYTLLSSGVFYLGELIALPCMVEEKPHWLLPGKVVGGLVAVMACAVGASWLGARGAGLGTLLGALTYAGLAALASSRASRIDGEEVRPPDTEPPAPVAAGPARAVAGVPTGTADARP
jgi:O-antigen/teichoic acid export membrane protein